MTRPPRPLAPPLLPQGPISFNAPLRRATSAAPRPAAAGAQDHPPAQAAAALQPSPAEEPSPPAAPAAALAAPPEAAGGTETDPAQPVADQAAPEGPALERAGAGPQARAGAAAAPRTSTDAAGSDHPPAAPHGAVGQEEVGRPPAKPKPREPIQAPDAPLTDAPSTDAPSTAGPAAEARGERIAKWLARAGVASRRDAEKLIEGGVIQLNGRPVTHPATFVTRDDIVQVRGKAVDTPDRTRLWRYHKPEGLVTTHKDPQDRPTVFQKLPDTLPRVVSVGRLDLNSEGLLLLTNDGALARRLELPANGWIRRYRVRVYGNVDPRTLAALANGVTVEGVRYGPIEAALEVRTTANSWLSVALKEGRNREIRKVMTHLNLQVTRLIRVAYGPFQLGNLDRGAVDEITGKVLREQLSGLPSPSSSGRKAG